MGISGQPEKHWEEAESCLCREISACLTESQLRDRGGTVLGKGLTPGVHLVVSQGCRDAHGPFPLQAVSTDRLYRSSGEFAEPREIGVRMSERQVERAKQKECSGRECPQPQAGEGPSTPPAGLLLTAESAVGPSSDTTMHHPPTPSPELESAGERKPPRRGCTRWLQESLDMASGDRDGPLPAWGPPPPPPSVVAGAAESLEH